MMISEFLVTIFHTTQLIIQVQDTGIADTIERMTSPWLLPM